MQLYIGDTYKTISKKSADELLQMIAGNEKPLLCTASGDSPKGMYQHLISQVNENNIDISAWTFLSLDEWLGMNGNDEGSCRFHLNNDLFKPLHVEESKIIFFDGRANNPDEECHRIEDFINDRKVIDVAIVGLGLNGHVGMNEPGTKITSRCHVAEIDSMTQQAGQKYFKESRQLTKGLTLGIANLMECSHVILIVSGSKKAGIVQQVLEEEISEERPASLLRNHNNFSVYLDKDAASLLQKK